MAARTPAPASPVAEPDPTGAQPRIVGRAQHYGDFLRLCRQRIQELKISYSTVDELAGLPAAYCSKIMAQTKTASGFTMFTLMRALALLPRFEHDEAQLAKLKSQQQWQPGRWPEARYEKAMPARSYEPASFKIAPIIRQHFAAMGGEARSRKLNAEQRSLSAQRAANARWRKARVRQRDERRASK